MKCVKYHLTNESIRYNAIQYLRTCDLDIIVEFKQRNRSLDQNRKLWACLGDVSRQVEWHGRWLDAESWKCVFTGSSGSPALGADIRSRASGGDQRKLYNAAQRIQGKMQNQGIAAARDMGASGINTVAEAKMYFQGMPQVDFSSPEALQQSMRDIQQYTDNYNQQYNVNVGKSQRQQSQPTQVSQPAASSNFSSLWGD